jgi:hypothetical protein
MFLKLLEDAMSHLHRFTRKPKSTTKKMPKRPMKRLCKLILALGLAFIPAGGGVIAKPVTHYVQTFNLTLYQDGHTSVTPTSTYKYIDLGPTP